VKRLFFSNVNDIVDKLTDEEKTLNYAVRKMEEEISKARDGLVVMMVNQKQIVRERDKAKQQVVDVNSKIKASLGDKDQAVMLIKSRQGYEAIVKQYDLSIKQQDEHIAKMKRDIQTVGVKVEQLRSTKNILLARKAIAETRKVIFCDIVIDNRTVEEMEQRVERKEIMADVWEEMDTSISTDDSAALEEYDQMVGDVKTKNA